MLASRFQELRDRTAAAVDRVFAEPVLLSPMKNGRPDPEREPHTFDSILRTDQGTVSALNGAKGSGSQDWRPHVSKEPAEIHIDRSTYTGPAIAIGDVLQALSRHGTPLFEVISMDTRSHTRLVLHLGTAG